MTARFVALLKTTGLHIPIAWYGATSFNCRFSARTTAFSLHPLQNTTFLMVIGGTEAMKSRPYVSRLNRRWWQAGGASFGRTKGQTDGRARDRGKGKKKRKKAKPVIMNQVPDEWEKGCLRRAAAMARCLYTNGKIYNELLLARRAQTRACLIQQKSISLT